jgi:predicted Zn-dependent peptidase
MRSVYSLLLLSSVVLAGPPIPPPAKWGPPVVQVRSLASGAKLWVLSQKGVPLVHVGVLVDAGSLGDPADKPGLAMLTATCVEEAGSGAHSGAEVRAFFDSMGTSLKVEVAADGVSLQFTALTPRLEAALGQVIEVLGKPRFDGAEVAAVKQRRRSEVVSALDSPVMFGNAQLLAEVFGANPRNHLELGTVAGVEASSADDLKQFHAAHWSPGNTTFFLVGDVDADAAKAMLDKVAPKAWLPGSAKVTASLPSGAPGKWIAFDKADAAQTVVFFGKPGPAATEAVVTPLELASTLLGGSFTSRLVQNLREKHGYTYGARAGLSGGRETKLLMVYTSVKTEVTAPALTELLSELVGITRLEPAELEKARSLLDARQLEDFASGESAVEALQGEAMEDLGPGELAAARARREKVTMAELTAAAAKFDPESFTVVLVGDRKKLEKELKAKFPTHNIEWR